MIKNPTNEQSRAISSPSGKLLVSASAGTGKTTVMIDRLCKMLLEKKVSLDEVVVVTFTNLSAADMKHRLTKELSESTDPYLAEQLEKIDSCNISTLHSFCVNLLRNYFYVVGVDPSFAIIDDLTINNMRSNVLSDVLKEYYRKDDEVFERLYHVFDSKRNEESLKSCLLSLYDFSRCQVDFAKWYDGKRANYLSFGEDNLFVRTINRNLRENAEVIRLQWQDCAHMFGKHDLSTFVAPCQENEDTFRINGTFEQNVSALKEIKLKAIPSRKVTKGEVEKVDKDELEKMRAVYEDVVKQSKAFIEEYAFLTEKPLSVLYDETKSCLQYLDKIFDILQEFDKKFALAKKQRGGLDFADLEHFTLQLLNDEEAVAEISERYKTVFVDEYQDINNVQEAIISALRRNAKCFMVGDVKQSIYGFRGCEPSIFLEKYKTYKNGDGEVVELNENFRSDKRILDFVNVVMDETMTEDFGKIDYRRTARLKGNVAYQGTKPSVCVELIDVEGTEKECADGIYDISAEVLAKEKSARFEGELIAQKIKSVVGSYAMQEGKVGKKDENEPLKYGDVAILVHDMTDNAVEIYNVLVENNIPVCANFKNEGFHNKEIRDIVNLIKTINNPYDDVALLGAGLSPLGNLSEQDLTDVRIATMDVSGALIDKFYKYVGEHKNPVTERLAKFLDLVDYLRFYACSVEVDQLVLEIINKTNYNLFVQSFPNGSLRIRKLYEFIDEIKGKYYSESVSKFVNYVEENENGKSAEGGGLSDAVHMITMHGSKGLEFPVVIVALTSTRFKSDKDTVKANSDGGFAMKYYDFDTMKVHESIADFAVHQMNSEKKREEELRLLYVALTRAKYNLTVVCSNSGKFLNRSFNLAKNANSHAEWILTALAKRYGDELEDGFCKDGIQLQRWQGEPTEEEVKPSLVAEDDEDVAEALEKINWTYSHAGLNVPGKVVSSSLDKARLDDSEQPESAVLVTDDGDRSFAEEGTAYHKVLEKLPFNATISDVEKAMAKLIDDGVIEGKYADTLNKSLIVQTLSNPQLLAVAKGKVYHELPFMLNVDYAELGEGNAKGQTILQGVIDLLAVDGNKATVVDFKYTKSSRFVEKNYSKQLFSYKLAVKRITGIDDVDCYVLSIADNKLIKFNV